VSSQRCFVSKLILHTHGASPRRGLLCSEYPLDSKGKKGNRLRSPFRPGDAASKEKRKKGTTNNFCFGVKQSVWEHSAGCGGEQLRGAMLSFLPVTV